MTEAKSSFSEILGRVAYGGQQFVIQRRGKPLAVVIGMAEYEEFLLIHLLKCGMLLVGGDRRGNPNQAAPGPP
ncbi:MAG: type II toxin-antitoxin system Phd/YefM family antitoxin [Anaerolineae bacterium]